MSMITNEKRVIELKKVTINPYHFCCGSPRHFVNTRSLEELEKGLKESLSSGNAIMVEYSFQGDTNMMPIEVRGFKKKNGLFLVDAIFATEFIEPAFNTDTGKLATVLSYEISIEFNTEKNKGKMYFLS